MRSHTRKWKTEEAIKAVEEILADLEQEPDRLSRAEALKIREALALLTRAVTWKLDDLKALRRTQ
jgi:hypothetical protein